MGNGPSNGSAVLLTELKALVDSFPHRKRTGVIKTIETILTGLDAHYSSLHSVNLRPEANTVLRSLFSEAGASLDLENQRHSEDQEQKEEGER